MVARGVLASRRILNDFEKHYFAEVMKQCGYDIKVAEERTGLSMQSLYRLLEDPRLNHRCLVVPAVLAEPCSRILTQFFVRQRQLGKK